MAKDRGKAEEDGLSHGIAERKYGYLGRAVRGVELKGEDGEVDWHVTSEED